MTVLAKDVQVFFERVATDRDTMRRAYYDEQVIERMSVSVVTSTWPKPKFDVAWVILR